MLKVGTSLKIRKDDRDYSSRIEEIDSEHLYLSAPIEQGRLIYFMQGENISGYIVNRGAVYNFKQPVEGHISKPVPLLKVKKPEKLKKIQRRQFFRLEKKMPTKFRLLDDDCETELSETKGAYALDISGGGMKLATVEVIPISSYLELNFDLDIEEGSSSYTENIICLGKIVRSEKIDSDRVTIYHYGIKFESLPQYIQDIIIRFIFNEQRKLRTKGRYPHAKRE